MVVHIELHDIKSLTNLRVKGIGVWLAALMKGQVAVDSLL
jgi:hypothetical protein